MLLVSACLAGINCKYNGGNNLDPVIRRMAAEGIAIPVCPEQLGGLRIPRPPVEIQGGDGRDVLAGRASVRKSGGEDVTEALLQGARETLALARRVGASAAILKDGSPSCGSTRIYDGTFSGTCFAGEGVAAAYLRREGMRVYAEDNYPESCSTTAVEAIARVRLFLEQTPYRPEIIEFDASTHTSELAALAVGVEVGQIAKSILFIIGDQPVLVVTSGDVKVSQSKLKHVLGVSGKVKLADPETTITLTGFPPGGVCPFALKQDIPVLIDQSMERFPVVFAAAGTPRSAVPVSVAQLLDITGGRLCDLASS